MSTRFDVLYPLVRASEGGYSDHPDDKGGRTKWGVTQATYDAYRRAAALPVRHVKELTESECRAIYLDYWRKAGCGAHPPGLDYAVFDASIHAGPARAKEFAALSGGDIDAFARLRLEHLMKASSWATFERGWRKRLAEVTERAKDMARKATELPGDYVEFFRSLVGKVRSKSDPCATEFFVTAGRPELAGQDYCAALVSHVLAKTGWPNPKAVAARALLRYGRAVDGISNARRGDIFVFWRVSRNAWQGHTGIILSVTPDAVETVEGNVRGAIVKRSYSHEQFEQRLLGIRRPVRGTAERPPAQDQEPRAKQSDEALREGATGPRVVDLQRKLRALHYPVGRIDGEYGPQTRRAVLLFQDEHGLEGERGVWLPEYNSVLEAAEPLLPGRMKTDAKDLEAMGDRPTRVYSFWERILAFLGLGSLAGMTADEMESLPTFFTTMRQALEPLIALWAWITSHPWLLTLSVIAAAFLLFRFLKRLRVQEFRHFDYQGPYKEKSR